MVWPLKGYRTISSTFGEYRAGHLHMGIDIRIGGVSGAPVLAVADGCISRLKVQLGGYGKTLYLTIDDGSTVVFAHLQSFIPSIEEFVSEHQWNDSSFYLDIFLPGHQFPVKAGQVIAYSGRSGTVIPHLHFEIRLPYNRAVNPLSRGFEVKDSRAPIISKLAVIPLDAGSEVNGDCIPAVYISQKQIGEQGSPYCIIEVPEIYGVAGFAVSCYDRADRASNPIAPYRLRLFIDHDEVFFSSFDYCDYADFKQVELDRNPYLNRTYDEIFQCLYCACGNDMPVYSGKGEIDTRILPPGIHPISIAVEDYYANESIIEFDVNLLERPTIPTPAEIAGGLNWGYPHSITRISPDDVYLSFHNDWLRLETVIDNLGLLWLGPQSYSLHFNSAPGGNIGRISLRKEMSGFNYLAAADGRVLESWYIEEIIPHTGGKLISPDRRFRVNFPQDGVYDTLYAAIQPIDVESLPPGYEYAGKEAYRLEPQWVPLKRSACLTWQSPDTTAQLGIYFLNDDKMTFLGNERDGFEVKGSCLNLETIAPLYDRDAPFLEIEDPLPGSTIRSDVRRFTFALDDTLSRIDPFSLEVSVDGRWALPEYDAPIKKGYGYIRWRLSPGKHLITISVSDNSGNRVEKTATFYVK